MMNFEVMKKALLGKLTPEGRKLVIGYAMQAAVLGQIEAQALAAGASRTQLEMARNSLPMLLAFLEKDDAAG